MNTNNTDNNTRRFNVAGALIGAAGAAMGYYGAITAFGTNFNDPAGIAGMIVGGLMIVFGLAI